MSREHDQASDIEQMERDIAMNNLRNSQKPIVSTGECLQCGKAVSEEKRWCDNFCRDDWQRWNPEA